MRDRIIIYTPDLPSGYGAFDDQEEEEVVLTEDELIEKQKIRRWEEELINN